MASDKSPENADIFDIYLAKMTIDIIDRPNLTYRVSGYIVIFSI